MVLLPGQDTYIKLSTTSLGKERSYLPTSRDGKNSPSLFTYHTHDDFDSADPGSMQDASGLVSIKAPLFNFQVTINLFQ